MLLQLDQVSFCFPREHWLLLEVNLDIQARETFAVIGPSGEGKTTVLKLLAGLLHPNSGRALFDGVELARLGIGTEKEYRKRIGMTFQKSGLFDSLTAFQNLELPLQELVPLPAKERKEKIEFALEEVGLGGMGSLFPAEMSGGMQKRLGIARALLLSPEVILYDEPTAGLDPITSRQIINLIRQVREKYHMTVVIVSSDPELIFPESDRVGFLYRGRFLQVGTVAEIRGSENPEIRQFIRGEAVGPLIETNEEELS